jgi:uncharacterized protein (DUF1499 family)
MLKYIPLIALFFLMGCVSTRPIPEAGVDFQLDRCTPFLNCVSSESSVFIYKVAPIELVNQLDQNTWQKIKVAALDLPGATLKESRYGYLNVTIHSVVFRFADYFEVLVSEDNRLLNVRSQSLVGLYDVGVNRARVEQFRSQLVSLGVAKE